MRSGPGSARSLNPAIEVPTRAPGSVVPRSIIRCEFRDLGRMRYREAWALQQELVDLRKQDRIPDQFLVVEHPHVVTLGRNAHQENVLASEEILSKAGIELCATDRGGDVTYHGPGQIVGYPILDLKQWRRDVGAYVRSLEQVVIDTLAGFGIESGRVADCTGVWTNGPPNRLESDPCAAGSLRCAHVPQKIAAIGVHLSRWVTSHGFALNLDTDLSYFRYIVPCGLTRPVTSMAKMGAITSRAAVTRVLAENFGRVFEREMVEPVELAAARHDGEKPWLMS